MQSDGNLVIYEPRGKDVWASGTFGNEHRSPSKRMVPRYLFRQVPGAVAGRPLEDDVKEAALRPPLLRASVLLRSALRAAATGAATRASARAAATGAATRASARAAALTGLSALLPALSRLLSVLAGLTALARLCSALLAGLRALLAALVLLVHRCFSLCGDAGT
jgi:hypothetical protein